MIEPLIDLLIGFGIGAGLTAIFGVAYLVYKFKDMM